jgi:phage baseplate assembly protein W
MIDVGNIFGRGISFPPRVGPNGKVAWSEGEANIREAIRIILMTEPGERLYLPEFGGGLRQYLFEPNNAATHHLLEDQISKALERWEPRIELQSVTVEPDPEELQRTIATIQYKLVATQSLQRLSLTFTLGS